MCHIWKKHLVENERPRSCCRGGGGSADKCGSTRRWQDCVYGPCARVRARLKFCESSVPLQLRDCISKLRRITSWKSRASDLFECNGQYKCSLALSLCSPLIVRRCSARLCVPHLVAAGSHRRHIRRSGFIIERKRGMELVFNTTGGSVNCFGFSKLSIRHPRRSSMISWILAPLKMIIRNFDDWSDRVFANSPDDKQAESQRKWNEEVPSQANSSSALPAQEVYFF